MSAPASGSGIGQPVPRREDIRLLTGGGCYSDDVSLPGQAYAAMLRSPYAHAAIRRIDAGRALALPGVLTVLTGADLVAEGLPSQADNLFAVHPADLPLDFPGGKPAFSPKRYVLAVGKVRFVGEPVAVVIATTVAAARDGAEAIEVDWQPLPAVTDAMRAAETREALVWEEHGSNLCVEAETGDRSATDAAFAKAAHVVRLATHIKRVTGVPMEPRAVVADYDAGRGHYTVHAGNGGAVRMKHDIAAMLAVSPDQVRAVMGDVGGNFGTRGQIYPEFMLVAWAARRIGRPVKWTAERSESFLTDFQARDLYVTAELALDRDGTFLALRGTNLSNGGANIVSMAPLQKGVLIASSIYRMPSAHFHARGVLTNTMATRSYRSAGRPETMYVMERLIDLACRRHGFDRVAIRRHNLITQAELPYRNPFGMVYDSGDYVGVMDRALQLGDWQGFPARKVQARLRGRLSGIAVANYVDTATGVPRERGEITVHPDGRVDMVVGTVSNGQGHETSFAQLLHEWLGVPIESVRLIQGDTDVVQVGGGTHSGRGMRLVSIVLWKASQQIIERARRIAALLMQAEPADVRFERGRLVLAGSDRALSLTEIATAAAAPDGGDLPAELRGPLAAVCDETFPDAGFPYGAHVCEVEVDPETGVIEIVRHAAVDDAGVAVNPLIIHGQTHGGIAQGVGQALFEQIVHDPVSGQQITGSFMDYAMPRADTLPRPVTEISEVPATSHPLGIRPAGEGGTTPALAVVVNAVVDALSELGVEHIEMPLTPERVWRAIREAQQAGAADQRRRVPDSA
jgi:carbon-monoxide dehydrogenase large subunit